MAIVTLYLKHNDRAVFDFEDFNLDGYLPAVGILGGDSTTLKIDNETGQIIGWKPILSDQLREFLEE
jgi:hypothetical protein